MGKLPAALFLASVLPGCTLFPRGEAAPAADEVMAFVVDRVYASPEREPLLNATVVVANGKIASVGESGRVKIPARVRVIQARGMSLMAGFWNSHVHFIGPKFENAGELQAQVLTSRLNEMLTRHGFVHVFEIATFSLENTLALRARIRSGEVQGPDIYTTGVPFVPPDGTPAYLPDRSLPEMADAGAARAFVRKQLAAGADGVKFFAASPTRRGIVAMPLDVARAAVEVAHESKRPVFAHPTTVAGVRLAARSGVDVLAHVSPDDMDEWNDELVDLLKSRNVSLIPTLKLFRWDPERQGAPPGRVKELLELASGQLSRFSRAGGTVLFGTDVGYVTDYSPREEFALMGQAGMSFAQILASLTTSPARKFGAAARTGTIAVGMDADLVLVEGDPRVDVTAFSAVRYVVLGGRMLHDCRPNCTGAARPVP